MNKKKRIIQLSTLLLGAMLTFPSFAQSKSLGKMSELEKMKSGVKNREISSSVPTGGNRDHLVSFVDINLCCGGMSNNH